MFVFALAPNNARETLYLHVVAYSKLLYLVGQTMYNILNSLTILYFQTFWRVPPYAQVLLWLPGPLSVAVFSARFSWALCHSQTKRIHQALDGIQGKMASQLGFMSVVKQEVLTRFNNFGLL